MDHCCLEDDGSKAVLSHECSSGGMSAIHWTTGHVVSRCRDCESSDPPGTTSLTGEVMDNAAIYGVLSTLSSLGLTLISCHVVPEQDDEPQSPLAPLGRTKEE